MVFRTPDWIPLERALMREYGEQARDAANAFWFVGIVNGPDDVGELRMYEHNATRRQLILDTDGRAYRKLVDHDYFSPICIQDALVEALA